MLKILSRFHRSKILKLLTWRYNHSFFFPKQTRNKLNINEQPLQRRGRFEYERSCYDAVVPLKIFYAPNARWPNCGAVRSFFITFCVRYWAFLILSHYPLTNNFRFMSSEIFSNIKTPIVRVGFRSFQLFKHFNISAWNLQICQEKGKAPNFDWIGYQSIRSILSHADNSLSLD